jgi:hypothetical protein
MGATFTLAREMWVEEPGRKWRQTKKNKSGDKKLYAIKSLLYFYCRCAWNGMSTPIDC